VREQVRIDVALLLHRTAGAGRSRPAVRSNATIRPWPSGHPGLTEPEGGKLPRHPHRPNVTPVEANRIWRSAGRPSEVETPSRRTKW